MKQNYPKFDQKIQDVINNTNLQRERTRNGVLISYDRLRNTAKVMLEDKYSDSISDVLTNVPCPFVGGMQVVAPEPGTRCVVGFRNTSETNAYIISFYASPVNMNSFIRNNYATTQVPRYLV